MGGCRIYIPNPLLMKQWKYKPNNLVFEHTQNLIQIKRKTFTFFTDNLFALLQQFQNPTNDEPNVLQKVPGNWSLTTQNCGFPIQFDTYLRVQLSPFSTSLLRLVASHHPHEYIHHPSNHNTHPKEPNRGNPHDKRIWENGTSELIKPSQVWPNNQPTNQLFGKAGIQGVSKTGLSLLSLTPPKLQESLPQTH